MIRATTYLLVAGAIWLAEGFLFSRYLDYHPWQTVLMALIYITLLSVTIAALVRLGRTVDLNDQSLPAWRLLGAAPMIAVILGSFMSLPLLLLILALGKV